MDYKEAWDNAPTWVRDYWNSVAWQYRGQSWPAFTYGFSEFPRARPFRLFKICMQLQEIWYGAFDAQVVLFINGDFEPVDGDWNAWGLDTWCLYFSIDQIVAAFEEPPDPLPRKVRKTYWTGVSRRRRNL